MTHPEYDRLISLAFGETDDDAAGHLAGCVACQADLATLRQVAAVGAETQSLRDLPAPPPTVWAGIQAAVGNPAAAAGPPDHTGPTDGGAGETGAGGQTLPPPVDLAAERARRRPWPRWTTAVAASVAAVAVAVAVTLAVAWPRTSGSAIVASAALTAYGPTPKTAHGDAEVLADGQLRLQVAGLPATTGYYQVWLIDPATTQMFPLGVLGQDASVQLPLPGDVDLTQYSLVDVSDEQYDNNPAHSGHSLLRGQLT